MSWALLLSSFYSWRNWDIESFICLPIVTQVGRSETRHTDLRAHTLGHCGKMFDLTSLWSPCFVRSQHLTAGWEPYQNNRKQNWEPLKSSSSLQTFPQSSSYSVCPQLCQWWKTNNNAGAEGCIFLLGHLAQWPWGPVCSLFAPEPVLTLKVKARLMEH